MRSFRCDLSRAFDEILILAYVLVPKERGREYGESSRVSSLNKSAPVSLHCPSRQTKDSSTKPHLDSPHSLPRPLALDVVPITAMPRHSRNK